jgi:poly(3-hydroxybutyrate) depolymerase
LKGPIPVLNTPNGQGGIMGRVFVRVHLQLLFVALISSLFGCAFASIRNTELPTPPPQPSMKTDTISVPENGGTQTLVYLEDSEKAPKGLPLVVVLHGGEAVMDPAFSEKVARRYLSVWGPYQDKVVSVAPTTTWGWGWSGLSIVHAAIRYAEQKFGTDPERVFLWGQSMGGHGAWRFAMWRPDEFAGTIPICGGYDFGDRLETLVNTPVYHIQGDKDDQYTLKPDALKNADCFKKQNELHPGLYDYTFRYLDGGHALFESEIPAILKWMEGKRRLTNPTKIRRLGPPDTFLGWKPSYYKPDQPADFPHAPPLSPVPADSIYWFRVDALNRVVAGAADTPFLRTRYSVEKSLSTEGLGYVIETENISAFSLRLLDEELKRPLSIRLNGKDLDSGAWQLTPSNEVKISVE